MAQSSKSPAAHWQGSLRMPGQGQGLAIAVDLIQDSKGQWVGSAAIPDLGSSEIKLSKVTVEVTSIKFEMAGLPGSPAFVGKLSTDGDTLAGTFITGKNQTPLEFKRSGTPKVKLPVPSSPLTKEFEGAWHGTLGSGVDELQLIMKLARSTDGTALGEITTSDKNIKTMPLDSIVQKGKALQFDIPSIAGKFSGRLNAAGTEITGTWSQAFGDIPMTFKKR